MLSNQSDEDERRNDGPVEHSGGIERHACVKDVVAICGYGCLQDEGTLKSRAMDENNLIRNGAITT